MRHVHMYTYIYIQLSATGFPEPPWDINEAQLLCIGLGLS